MIARCFASSIRGIGRVGRGLAKRRIGREKRAIYFICRHMMEEIVARRVVVEPAVFRRFKERMRADNVGVNKGIGAGYRSIDMTFRGKMYKRIDRVVAKQTFN